MVSTHRAMQGKRPRNYVYNVAGLDSEVEIKELLSQHHDLLDSEAIEDMTHDIDCHLDGAPCSIKTQHAGLKYGNIGFELTTQHWQAQTWNDQPEWFEILREQLMNCCPGFNPVSWRPSWFLTGKAEIYAIRQGDTVALYRKSDLEAYIREYGFFKVAPLSRKLLQAQANKNTICGYLRHISVQPYAVYKFA